MLWPSWQRATELDQVGKETEMMTCSKLGEDVENMTIAQKISLDLTDEMQDVLYDQLTRYTKSFLLTVRWVDLNRVWSLCARRWRTARRRRPRTYHRARSCTHNTSPHAHFSQSHQSFTLVTVSDTFFQMRVAQGRAKAEGSSGSAFFLKKKILTRFGRRSANTSGEMDEDDNLEAEEDVQNMTIDQQISPDLGGGILHDGRDDQAAPCEHTRGAVETASQCMPHLLTPWSPPRRGDTTHSAPAVYATPAHVVEPTAPALAGYAAPAHVAVKIGKARPPLSEKVPGFDDADGGGELGCPQHSARMGLDPGHMGGEDAGEAACGQATPCGRCASGSQR